MWCPLYIRCRTLLLGHCPFTQSHFIYPPSCSSTVRNQFCSAHIYITTTSTVRNQYCSAHIYITTTSTIRNQYCSAHIYITTTSTVRNQYCSAHIYITTTYTTTRCSTCCVMYVFTESKKYSNTHIILSPIWCPHISAVMVTHCSYSILFNIYISYDYIHIYTLQHLLCTVRTHSIQEMYCTRRLPFLLYQQ
jgi:hypothetical protein